MAQVNGTPSTHKSMESMDLVSISKFQPGKYWAFGKKQADGSYLSLSFSLCLSQIHMKTLSRTVKKNKSLFHMKFFQYQLTFLSSLLQTKPLPSLWLLQQISCPSTSCSSSSSESISLQRDHAHDITALNTHLTALPNTMCAFHYPNI